MKKINRIIGTLIGNTMEFYDFTIYAFLTAYISKEFFRFDNPIVSYLAVFGVFASGYLTRPLGALLFGYVGDRQGRSKALSISIIISIVIINIMKSIIRAKIMIFITTISKINISITITISITNIVSITMIYRMGIDR
jgi:MFS family permease